MIAHNANLDLPDGIGDTPLSIAIDENNLDMVELLVENGASTNIHDAHGETPFQKAILRKHIDIIKYFMDNGDDLSSRTKNPRYTIIELPLKENQIDIMKNLIFH